MTSMLSSPSSVTLVRRAGFHQPDPRGIHSEVFGEMTFIAHDL